MSENSVTPEAVKVNLLLNRVAAQAKRYEEEITDLRLEALMALQQRDEEIKRLKDLLEENEIEDKPRPQIVSSN